MSYATVKVSGVELPLLAWTVGATEEGLTSRGGRHLRLPLRFARPRKGEGAKREGRHVYGKRTPRGCVSWRPREDRT